MRYTNHTWFTLLGAAAILTFAPLGYAQEEQKEGGDEKPAVQQKGPAEDKAQTIQDKIAEGQTEKVHKIALKKGIAYRIEMQSGDLDSYLIVKNQDGENLASDDDSGDNLNARLIFRAPESATYEIVATTFGKSQSGPYTLTITPQAPAAQAKLVNGQAALEGQFKEGVSEKSYEVALKKGVYVIEMKSDDFDTYLILKNDKGKELVRNDDIGQGDLNSRLSFTPKEAGNYEIVATSFNKGSASGAYTLTIKEFTKAGKAQTFQGKVDNNAPKLMNVAYQSFKMKLKAGMSYQIDVKSKDIDSVVGVRKDGEEKLLAGNDDVAPGNLDAGVFFTPEEDGTYEIIGGALPSGVRQTEGDFVLTVQPYRSGDAKKNQQK